jgi:hypothetical protein
MSRDDESRYNGVSGVGGPASATARMLRSCGCCAAHETLDGRTITTSEWGGSYLSVPRKGTVFRSARTLLLQQEVCTYVRTGPSVFGGAQVHVHRTLAIMGHTYKANGSPILKMANRPVRVEATKILSCLRRMKKRMLSDIQS